jgi:sulfur-oxidizing protein SoxY
MTLTRRHILGLAGGGLALAVVGPALRANAAVAEAEAKLAEFAGGAAPQTGKITLDVPEIAENGNNVPVSFRVDSAMEGSDLVESVIIVTDGNPNPVVSTFTFTAMSGAAAAMTRARLSKTQNVIAMARMADGSVYMDRKEVKVTIGGCGG